MKTPQQKFIFCAVLFFTVAACDEEQTAVVSDQQVNTESLQPRLTSLVYAVENAESLRSIKRLQWAYGHYSELGLWYDFADLFADSGVGHYVQGDLNRDQIRALFYDQVGQGRLGLAAGRIYPHISFSPVVDLADDGIHANGRFRILAMLGGYGGNATWFHGVYENAYVKEQGVWKLNELSNTAQVSGNFKTGLTATSKVPLDIPTFPFHFVPEQVGEAGIAAKTDVDAGATSSSAEKFGAELSSLQQRLDRLQDEVAITRLQHQYGFYLDEHKWSSLAELFAEQGTFETGQQGVYIGKTSIRNALNQFGIEGAVTGVVDEHILFQTYVSVAPDGESAKARVDQLGMQGKQGESAEWTQGIYENTFVKENGEWRIQSVHYYPRLITDYAKGWAEDAQPAAGPSAEYPPDAPATENYAIFPEFYIPAFHFAHPVTGRAPQYPGGDPAINRATGFEQSAQTASYVPQLSDGTALQAQFATAEIQVQQALAYDAVENLINAYAYYLDECLPQQAAMLFAQNGRNEIPGVGYYQGGSRIANALQLAYCP
ncbi:MAG: nuclear transport factor 2 family protein, partial [Pseudomonadota bacterium]